MGLKRLKWPMATNQYKLGRLAVQPHKEVKAEWKKPAVDRWAGDSANL